MKKTISYLIVGALAIGSLSSCDEHGNIKPPLTTKQEETIMNADSTIVKELIEQRIYSNANSEYKIMIAEFSNKIESINHLVNGKITEVHEEYLDFTDKFDSKSRPIRIYSIVTPENEELKILSEPENIYAGETHSFEYLKFKKNMNPTVEDLSWMYYGTTSFLNKTIYSLDGILIKHEQKKR